MTDAPIVHGNTTYSQSMYMLFVNHQPIRLTSMEIRLLTALLRRFSKPVRKAVIFDEIYGHRPTTPRDTAINVTMCRLRRKLREAGSDLTLRALRGQGIVLAAKT